jgi:hypothetical protein
MLTRVSVDSASREGLRLNLSSDTRNIQFLFDLALPTKKNLTSKESQTRIPDHSDM